MQPWKKILLRAAGFGGGFAIVAAVIIGTAVWWSGRPVKPKPWNTRAISATYDGLSVSNGTLSVWYALANNTDDDFRISSDEGVHLGAELKEPKVLSFTDKEHTTIDYPIYVPARRSVRFAFNVVFLKPEVGAEGITEDEKLDYQTKLAQFAVASLPNVEHFVLMDDTDRDEIDLPIGWEKQAKQPLKVKSSDASK
jgi:hypothetical protein